MTSARVLGPGAIRLRGGLASLLAAALALGPAPAFAQPPQPAPAKPQGSAPAAPAGGAEEAPAAPTEADKEEARRQFEKGLELLNEEAWSAALAAFLRSRELYPTRGNTNNAAICLRKLQRYDEALDMFEVLLRDFPNLPPDDKLEALKAVAELRERVGTIDVTGAEPGAAIVVDGQARGDFPPVTPIRAGAGSHLVRVLKEGYEPFEARVDVAGGQSARIVAKMRKLTDAGRLKVLEQGGRTIDVVIDGSIVGQTPWEGPMAIGEHMVLLRGKGKVGTQPALVVVQSQKTAMLQLRAEDLEASLRVEPTPVSAKVAVDRVTVGSGPWAGRMRTGKHRVEVWEDGFVRTSKEIILEPGEREIVSVELERDPRAERWQKPARWVMELNAGATVVPSFGGEVAGGCGQSCSLGLGAGGIGMLRGGYELGWGLGFGLEAGYFAAFQAASGRSATVVPVGLAPQPGTADDQLRLDGAVVGATTWLRFGERFPVGFKIGAGAVLGRVRDDRQASFTARSGGTLAPPDVADMKSATYFYLDPEVSIGARIGDHFELGAAAAAFMLIAPAQPRWDDQKQFFAGQDGVATYPAEALTGAFVLAIVPSLRARYDF